MDQFFITVRSVTVAQRGKSLLEGRGIRCSLQRTPRWMEEKGCGYALQIPGGRLHEAAQILQAGRIAYRKAYAQHSNGDVEEVAL